MARFYTNENFPMQAVQLLRSLGHDVLTSHEAGKANQSITDEDVLAFAGEQDRILLTMNRKHFIKLHQLNPRHCGIVACTFNPDYPSMANQISEVVKQNELVIGKLIRINRTRNADDTIPSYRN